MAISQFRLFKICTCLVWVLSFFKRIICRSGRFRKLSGDQITLPMTVDLATVPKQDLSSVPKKLEVEDWSSWDEEGPTSIRIEGGNGNVTPQPTSAEEEEPDYFKDMAPTITKTQKIVLKKREPPNFTAPDGSTGFSSRLGIFDTSFYPLQGQLGELDNWQEDHLGAWDEDSDAALEAAEVLRVQKQAERMKRAMEQQRKKVEKEAQRQMKKEQKIAIKLS
ncbi:receptor-binding cancer antigen expressed on SiSo cells-like [Scleropages formosus]|uniref:Estrogen receptor binding site associated antigen 9 n=1 Tax=Scleropages formosus TaxID=113540 RepID=A0A8C9RQG9_SCLFO|nr:receptor-binding cancer antigen expressed on SiSo cells-like [Scleropages formosus]